MKTISTRIAALAILGLILVVCWLLIRDVGPGGTLVSGTKGTEGTAGGSIGANVSNPIGTIDRASGEAEIPSDNPISDQDKLNFASRIHIGSVPVPGALVRHGGSEVVSNDQGQFAFSNFSAWSMLEFRPLDSPSVIEQVGRSFNREYELAAKSRIDIFANGNPPSLFAGLPVSLMYWPGRPGAPVMLGDSLVELWAGHLNADGESSANGIPTPSYGNDASSRFFVRIALPDGTEYYSPVVISWDRSPEGEGECLMSSVLEMDVALTPSFLKVLSSVQAESFRPKIAYRRNGSFDSPWRLGKVDENGLVLTDGPIQSHGMVMAWMSEKSCYGANGVDLGSGGGGQELSLPAGTDFDLSIEFSKESVLADRVNILATSIAWDSTFSGSLNPSQLYSGPAAPAFFGWTAIAPNAERSIGGGWFGNRMGTALRADPGGAIIYLGLRSEPGQAQRVVLPELGLVNIRINDGGLAIGNSSKLVFLEGEAQVVPYYFDLDGGNTTQVVVPTGEYMLYFQNPDAALPLGKHFIAGGESELALSLVPQEEYRLLVTYVNSSIGAGADYFDGKRITLTPQGSFDFMSEIGKTHVLEIGPRGAARASGSDGKTANIFLGFETEISIANHDSDLSIEIPFGLVLIEQGSRAPSPVIRRIGTNGLPERAAAVVAFAEDGFWRAKLPVGDYQIKFSESASPIDFKVFQDSETRL